MIGSVWCSSTDNGPTAVGSIRCLSMARRIGLRSECSAPSWCAKEAVDRPKSSRRLGSRRTASNAASRNIATKALNPSFAPAAPEAPTCSPRRWWPGLRNSCTEAGPHRRWPRSWTSNATPFARPSIRDGSRDRRAPGTRPPNRRPARQSPLHPLRTSPSAASRMRRPRWGSPARGRWSGWPRPWDCSTAPRPSFRFAATSPSAASCAPCRR